MEVAVLSVFMGFLSIGTVSMFWNYEQFQNSVNDMIRELYDDDDTIFYDTDNIFDEYFEYTHSNNHYPFSFTFRH